MKRFDNFQRKLSQFMSLNDKIKLNLNKLSNSHGNIVYKLSSALVHVGKSINSGHYYSYVRINNIWYKFNDSNVKKVQAKEVFNSSPYLVFYEKVTMELNKNINN
jgi:ubiquitin C-terminal hydrolase